MQSLGLWSNQGRVKLAWASLHGDKYQSNRNYLRFIEPGQSLYCTKKTSNYVYFRIDMRKLFAITRIVFIGKTKREGPFIKCDRDQSRKLLSLFSSLDGILWIPFGIYNQVHDTLKRQVTQIALTSKYLRHV